MSATIDERVVEMRFDNKHFEANVGTTMSTLEKLKQRLNLSGATKGLENINAAAGKCNLSPIAKGVETVQFKFSALQVAGVTALANLTNSAVNYGKSIANALTIEPVTAGFSEYELKMGSIQTIMASTGESLETVNGYLNELNEYSDKTIYSFSDMTTNIGKFTNAGVKLEDAVLAIQGISNAAAVSGANANEASRSMYNFAQALSAGYVKLIDWKSIELANMATVEFKQQLIDAAVAAGTLTKVTDGYKTAAGTVITPTKNFNDSLQDQWMTTDVLISTLKDYADETTEIGKKAFAAAQDVKTASQLFDTLKESAQSGWAQTWEIIVGDFEEAKSLFTYLSEVFGTLITDSANARNKVLEAALDGGGSTGKWDEYVKQINEAGIATEEFQNALLETAKTHDSSIAEMIKNGNSFEDVMKSGKITSEMITETLWKFVDGANEVSGATEDMTDKLEEMRNLVKRITKGEFGNGAERMKALANAGYDYAEVQALVNKVMAGGTIELSDLSDAQLKSAGYTEEQVKALRELAEQAEKTGVPIEELVADMNKMSGREMAIATIKNVLEQLGKVLDTIKEAWTEVFGEFDAGEALYNIIEGIYDFVGTAEITTETLEGMKNAFKGLFDAIWLIGTLGGGVIKTINTVLKAIQSVLGFGNIWQVLGWIGELISGFKNWITTNNVLSQALIDLGNSLKSFVESTIGSVKEWIEAFLALETVQEQIANFKITFKTTFSDLIEWFKGFGTLVTDFINAINSLDSITLDGVKSAALDFASNVVDHFENLPGVFGSLIDTIQSFADTIMEHLGFAADGVSAAGSVITSVFDRIQTKISEYYNNVKSWLGENVSFGSIVALIIGLGSIFAILKVAKVMNAGFNSIAKLTGSIKGAFDGLKDMFEGFKEARIIEAKANALRNIAISIAILAASLFVLGQMEWGQIGKGIVAMLGIVALLGGLAFALSKLGKLELDFYVGAGIIVALAASLLLIVGALKLMEDLDGDKVWDNVGVLGAIAAGLVAFVVILAKLAPKLSSGSFSLIMFSLSIGILVHSLNSIGNLELDNVGKSLLLLVGVIATLILVSKVCDKISIGTVLTIVSIALALKILVSTLDDIAKLDGTVTSDTLKTLITVLGMFAILMMSSKFAGKHALSAGIGIVAMSFALLLIIQVIKMMAELDSGTLENATKSIMGIMGVFALIVVASNFAGKHAMRAGAMLMLMSGAMLMLTASMIIMSQMDPTGLDNAVEAIQGIMIVMALLIAATKFVPAGIEKTVTMLAVSIAILAVAVAALSMIDTKNLFSATLAMSAVLGMFALVAHSAKGLEKCIGTLILMNVAVVLLAGSIWLLSDIPAENALSSAASLSMVLLAFSGALVIVGKATNITKKALAGVALMTGVLALMVGALWLLAELPVEGMVGKVAALSMLLLAFSGSLVLLGKAKPITTEALGAIIVMGTVMLVLAGVIAILSMIDAKNAVINAASLSVLVLALSTACIILGQSKPFATKALPAALAMAGIMAILAIILGAMEHFDVTPSIGTATALSILLLSLSAACVILAGAGMFGPAAFVGIGALLTLIIGVGGLMVAIGKLMDYVPRMQEFVDKAVPLLASIGEGIGAFFGNIVGGFVGGINNGALTETAKGLSNFMTEIQPFLDGVKNIDSSVISGIDSLALAMLSLSSAGFVDKLTSMFGGDSGIESLAGKLVTFGESMVAFSNVVSGNIDTAAVEASAAAGQALAALAGEVPNSGGLLSWIMGDNNLDEFGATLVPFGQAMVSFSNVVAGKIDQSAVEAAAAAGQVMVALGKEIPNTGGLLSWIMGDNDLTTFGAQLVPFGRAMVSFSNVVAGKIDQSAVEAAATAGEVMVGLAKEIPNSGGLLSWIMGDNNLDEFGKQLPVFGRAMVAFSNAVAGNIDQGAVEAAAAAGQVMVALANAVPANKSDFIEFFAGDDSLEGFGKQIKSFGEAMVDFSDTISGANNFSDAIAAIQNATALADMAMELSGKTFDLEPLTSAFESFADSLISFSDKITGKLDLVAITIASSACQKLSEAASIMPNEVDFTKVTNGLTQFGDALVDFSTSVEDGVNTEAVTKATDAGKSIVEMTQGIPAEVDLSTFATNITGVANGIKEFATISADISTDSVMTATDAGNSIATFMQNIPDYIDPTSFIENAGGIASAIVSFATQGATGNLENINTVTSAGTSIAYFMKDIPDYIDPTMFIANAGSIASAIVSFANQGANANLALVYNVTTAGNYITQFMQTIPTSIDPTSFIANAGGVANAIASFSARAVGVDSGKVMVAVFAGRNISSLLASIPQGVDVSSFTTALPQLSSSIINFASDMSTVSMPDINSIITSVISAVNLASSGFMSAGSSIAESIASGISSKSGSVVTAVTTVISSATNAIQTKVLTFTALGTQCINQLILGFSTGASTVGTTIRSIMSVATDAISTSQTSFYAAGTYLGTGLVSGINSKKTAAYNAGYALGQAAAQGVKDGENAASPSKEGIKAGKWLGEGLVIGIQKMGSAVYSAGHDMGETAVNSLSGVVSRITDAINSDMDTQPTIRPVLDLSDVESGAGLIGSMFGMTPSMAVLGNVGSINASMNRRIQNGVNSDVVSAIDKLRKDVGNLENRSYSIGGITYGNDSAVANAIETLVRAVRVEGRA